jgi:GH25 family lysozyme M1 (1,4-beta-N-acetylmuramidase)
MIGAALLAILAIEPDAALQSRPYGNVMGDGLGLRIETDPQAGGVCAPGETVFGIDVSYYQGTIDWPAVAAAGVQFAIIRVSHSLQFFDPEFEANLAGSRAAGIRTGVYQFFEPDEDPVAQADLLIEALGPLQPGDLPPMIDVESTGGQSASVINDTIHAWIDRVEGEYGVKPVIYSGFYFWNDNVNSTDFGEYPLMLPWYGVECPGGVPNGWDMWTIHQYCDCGSVGGIAGNVDVDTFNGSLADLDALAGAAECGDAMCTGGENPYTCAADCLPCGVIPAAGGTVDNGDACYTLYGDNQFWHEEAQGEGGSLIWTHATDYAEAYNYAIWQLHFEESGQYELEVHVVPPFGASTMAGYDIRHAGGEETVTIDQSANDGWVSLGEFQFDAATDHTVRLDDNTGDLPDNNVMLVYDALRVTRLDLDPEGSSGDPEETEGGSQTSDGEESSGGGGPGSASDGATSDSATDGLDPALPGANDDAAGCACTTSSPRNAAWLFALLLVPFVRRPKGTRLRSRRR